MTQLTPIQIRRDTAANWTSADPTLMLGEIGYETDTNKFKIGDGATAWAANSNYYRVNSATKVGGVAPDSTGNVSLASTNLSDGTALNAAVTAAAAAAAAAQGTASAAATAAALAATNAAVALRIPYAAGWNAASNVVTGVTGVTSLANSSPGTQTAYRNTATGQTTVSYLGSAVAAQPLNPGDEVLWNGVTGAWEYLPCNAPAILGTYATSAAAQTAYPAANWTGYWVAVGTTAPYTLLQSNGNAYASPSVSSLTVPITQNVVISVANNNVATYNGQTLEFEGAYTVEISAGLPAGFGFNYIPPASGVATISSDGTALLNGATTALTRSAALILGTVVQRVSNANSYQVI